MTIDTKRVRLFVTSLTLAVVALTAVMIGLFGISVPALAADLVRAPAQAPSESPVLLDAGQASVLGSTADISVPGEHDTIQEAIDAASPGDTIEVAAGTYEEFVHVDKAVTINGPFHGVPGYSESRGGTGEAIIKAPVDADRVDPSISVRLVSVSSPNVVIDGIKVLGDEDDNGEFGATVGIHSKESHFQCLNNVLSGIPKLGISIARPAKESGDWYDKTVADDGPVTDVLIRGNYVTGAAIVDTKPTWGFGIQLSGTVAEVIENTVDDSRVALAVQPYNQPAVELDVDGLVQGNRFESYRIGLFFHAGGVSGHYAVSGNWLFDDNVFALAEIHPDEGAVKYWAAHTRASKFYFDKSIEFTDNTFDTSNQGAFSGTWSELKGFTFRNDLGDHTSDDLSFVYSGNTFVGSGGEIYVQLTDAEKPSNPPLEIDLEAVLANNTFDRAVVVRGSDIQVPTIFSSIQDAIGAADTDDTIQVTAGTYTETVEIDKQVELHGANAGLCAGAGSVARGPESIVHAFWITGTGYTVTIDGFHVTGADFATDANPKAIYLQGSDHKIKNNVISGPGDGRGVVFKTDDASDIDILCNEIHGWLSGVDVNQSSQHSFQSNTFHDNLVGIESNNINDVEIHSNTFTDNTDGFLATGVLTEVVASFNSFTGNTYGIRHGSGAVITATNNWWGCNAGPLQGANGCDTLIGTGTVTADPWLLLNLTAHPESVFAVGETAVLTASLTTNSASQETSIDGHVPDGITTTFAAHSGTVTPTVTGTVSGLASTTYVAPNDPITEVVSATVHHQTVTLTLTVDQVDLQISKTDGVDEVNPGDLLTYTITITNASALDATGVVITESLPVSTTAVSLIPADWGQVDQTQVYTYALGILNAGAVTTTTFPVTVMAGPFPAGLHVLTNTVSVADDGTQGPDATPDDNIAYDENQLLAAPRLEISKSDGVDEVEPSDTLTYTITITNSGNQNSTGVVVTDTLPEHTSFVTATQSFQRDNNNNIVTWSLSSLAADELVTRSVTIQVQDLPSWPAGVPVITNSVEVSDDRTNGFTDTVTATDVNTVGVAPDLQITKVGDPDPVKPGQLLTYTITVTNAGDQEATGVVVTDALPLLTSFRSGAGWRLVSDTTYTYTVGNLPGAGVQVLTLTATVTDTVPAGRDEITNTVQVADDAQLYETFAYTTTLDAAPRLEVSKSDDVDKVKPGDTLTYTITISNSGNQDSSGVVVTDTLPEHTNFVTATQLFQRDNNNNTVTWSLSSLAADQSVTRTVTIQVQDLPSWPAGVPVITNTVEVVDDAQVYATDTDVNTVDVGPDLSIFKSRTGDGPVEPDDVVVYRLTYANTGSQDAKGVVITETLPNNTIYDDVGSPSDWQHVEGTRFYTYTVGELLAGSARTVDFAVIITGTLPAGVDVIRNEVEIGDDGTGGPDPNLDDNAAVHEIDVIAAPDLTAEKDDGQDDVAPGQVITYVLTIANVGNQGATGVVVTDELPDHTTFVAASDKGDESDGVVTWPVFSLSAGQTVYRTLTVQVIGAIPAGVETITNTVEVGDDDEAYATDTDVNTVQAVRALALLKTDGRDSVKPGERLTYTLTAKNLGQQDIGELTITDTLPLYTTFIEASQDGHESAGVVVWMGIELPVGAEVQRTVTVRVDDSLPSGVHEIVNRAEAVGDGGIVSDDASDVTAVEAGPNLRVTKTDGRTHARPGETLTYTLVVDNIGTQEATGVVLTDTLPAHVTFVDASHTGSHDDGAVTWSLDALEVGQVVTRTLTVVIDDPWPVGATPVLTNAAYVADDGLSGPDLDPTKNTGIDTTRVWAYDIYLPLISKQ